MADFVKQRPDAAKNINALCHSLNSRETAKIIGCCTKTLAKLCEDGVIAFHMVGNKRMFRPDDIEDFWNNNRSASKLQKDQKGIDTTRVPSVRSTTQRKGGDKKGTGKEPKNTEVSKAHRLKELSEEMRQW
jgi:excisionase family DNA binding protein